MYLLAVVLLATRFTRRAIFLTAALSALTWNFLFIPPVLTFRIAGLPDALMFVMYFVVALVIGQLTAHLRLRETSERRREQRAQALYRIAQSVVESGSLDQGLRSIIREVDTLFEAHTAVLLANPGGGLDAQCHPAGTWAMSEKEKAVSAWSFLNGKAAGRYTDTLPESEGLHLPLKTAQGKAGVLAIRFAQDKTLAVDERELIETLADHIAAIIERYRWMEAASRSRIAEESERLYKSLFDCVSHELKTPLAVMTTAASELNLLLASSPLKGGLTFLDEIETAVRRLRRVVDNLLDMTRLETGRLPLEAIWCDMDELMDAAQEQVADIIRDHRIEIVIKPELPSFKLDFALMQHTLSNLLSNAAQYSPPGTEIRVTAWREENQLVVRVSDRGPASRRRCCAMPSISSTAAPTPNPAAPDWAFPSSEGLSSPWVGRLKSSTIPAAARYSRCVCPSNLQRRPFHKFRPLVREKSFMTVPITTKNEKYLFSKESQ